MSDQIDPLETGLLLHDDGVDLDKGTTTARDRTLFRKNTLAVKIDDDNLWDWGGTPMLRSPVELTPFLRRARTRIDSVAPQSLCARMLQTCGMSQACCPETPQRQAEGEPEENSPVLILTATPTIADSRFTEHNVTGLKNKEAAEMLHRRVSEEERAQPCTAISRLYLAVGMGLALIWVQVEGWPHVPIVKEACAKTVIALPALSAVVTVAAVAALVALHKKQADMQSAKNRDILLIGGTTAGIVGAVLAAGKTVAEELPCDADWLLSAVRIALAQAAVAFILFGAILHKTSMEVCKLKTNLFPLSAPLTAIGISSAVLLCCGKDWNVDTSPVAPVASGISLGIFLCVLVIQNRDLWRSIRHNEVTVYNGSLQVFMASVVFFMLGNTVGVCATIFSGWL